MYKRKQFASFFLFKEIGKISIGKRITNTRAAYIGLSYCQERNKSTHTTLP